MFGSIGFRDLLRELSLCHSVHKTQCGSVKIYCLQTHEDKLASVVHIFHTKFNRQKKKKLDCVHRVREEEKKNSPLRAPFGRAMNQWIVFQGYFDNSTKQKRYKNFGKMQMLVIFIQSTKHTEKNGIFHLKWKRRDFCMRSRDQLFLTDTLINSVEVKHTRKPKPKKKIYITQKCYVTSQSSTESHTPNSRNDLILL